MRNKSTRRHLLSGKTALSATGVVGAIKTSDEEARPTTTVRFAKANWRVFNEIKRELN